MVQTSVICMVHCSSATGEVTSFTDSPPFFFFFFFFPPFYFLNVLYKTLEAVTLQTNQFSYLCFNEGDIKKILKMVSTGISQLT